MVWWTFNKKSYSEKRCHGVEDRWMFHGDNKRLPNWLALLCCCCCCCCCVLCISVSSSRLPLSVESRPGCSKDIKHTRPCQKHEKDITIKIKKRNWKTKYNLSECPCGLDFRLFCEILVQRPIQRPTLFLPSSMTEADLAHMRVMAQQHFDQIMAVLKDMPRCLLLVIRWGPPPQTGFSRTLSLAA